MRIFQQIFFRNFAHLLSVVFFAASFFVFSIKNSYAAIDVGVGRERTCDSNGGVEGMTFAPFTSDDKDTQFDLSNPQCLGLIVGEYAAVKAAIAFMNKVCGTGSAIPRVQPSLIQDGIDFLKASYKATADQKCGLAVAATLAPEAAFVGTIGGIYAFANDAYNNTELCGSNWMTANPSSYDISSPNYKKTVQDAVNGYARDGDTEKLNESNKTYREWYYGGVEVEDDSCEDVTQPMVNGAYPKQKYYMQGTAPGNFNCKKYDVVALRAGGEHIGAEKAPALKAAYECCQKKSTQYIFLHSRRTDETVFCKAGDFCSLAINPGVAKVTYSTKSLDNGSIICAQSYDFCPYNFTVGGGSEYCDYYQDGIWDSSAGRWTMISQQDIDAGNCKSKSEIRNSDCSYNNKANKCRNYCQYLTHCTVANSLRYQYKSELGSPYFSSACIDFVGDSLNQSSYGGDVVINSQKHFSAPIAQCVKESLENVFYNVAGHSRCLNVNEYPDSDGNCLSGSYAKIGNFVYQKGNAVKTDDTGLGVSFFTTLQNTLQTIVKTVLIMSVMFYGMNILVGKADIREKKDILMYLLKIGLVLYFATGDAWQSTFFKGVYNASSEFSRMVFKIDAQATEKQRDGCQFGMISVTKTLEDGSTAVEEESSGRIYPEGKEYLALWDTLDCKIMRYLGYGPEATSANIASIILAGYFSFAGY